MSKILKKIGIAIVGLSLLVMIVPTAQALTVEELQAQIVALTAQLAALQSQLAGLGGTSSAAPAACAGITFTQNLSQGVSGNDVKCLQALLNQSADTQVAVSGIGSLGNETTSFGPLTKAAVVKFQNKYAATILTPLGLTAGTGFVGAATRAKLNGMIAGTTPITPPITPIIPGTGTEGTLSVTAAATPSSAGTIYVGQIDKEIAGLNVKALGSDIKLSRLDFNFASRPWLNITNITITDGTTNVVYAVTQANTIEVTAGSSYLVRITGLNITVPNNTTKVLTVKVTPILVAGGSTATITYNIPANGLRGTDGISIEQYSPSTALTARTFTVTTASGALALSANVSNPVERAVIGSASAITENVELLRFDVKATINDVIVTQISTGSIADENDALQTLKLYDGDTLLAATSSVNGVAHVFKPLTLRVNKDTTKTLTIKADLEIVTVARLNASTSASVAIGGIISQDAGTYASITTTGSTATGKKIHAYWQAPSLALVSTSIATTREGRADASNTISAIGKIKFNVTASGGNIYFGSTTGNGMNASSSVNAASTTIVSTYASNATADSGCWLVRQGETKYFEVTSVITNAQTSLISTSGFFTYLKLTSILWGTSSTALTSYTWSWTDIPVEYRTTDILLQANN